MSYEQLIKDLEILYIQFKEGFIELIPKLIFAVLIVLIGLLVARLFKAIVSRFIRNLDRFISSRKLKSRLKQSRLENSSVLLSRIVYWIITIFFVTTATEVLGLPVITAWLSSLVQYMPNILVAVIIIFLGLIGGRLLKDIVSSASSRTGLLYANILGRIIQYATLFFSILVAIDQIGVDIKILADVIDIILAALLFGAALAFGLGARVSVSNILASYYVQNHYREGQVIKIAGVEGEIIQITNTMVIIATDNGQVTIPAKKFSEMMSSLLKKKDKA